MKNRGWSLLRRCAFPVLPVRVETVVFASARKPLLGRRYRAVCARRGGETLGGDRKFPEISGNDRKRIRGGTCHGSCLGRDASGTSASSFRRDRERVGTARAARTASGGEKARGDAMAAVGSLAAAGVTPGGVHWIKIARRKSSFFLGAPVGKRRTADTGWAVLPPYCSGLNRG